MRTVPQRQPVAWNVLLVPAAVALVLHALSNGPLAWGYMTDELYFLDSSDHLQWGYVDHPPLSIAVLALLRPLTGDSIFAIRILPALLGAATIVVTGLMAREMGGGRTAQGLAALAILAAPIFLAMSSYYSMNAFDELLWPLGMWLLLRIVNGGSARLWLALGLVMAVGLLNKVSMLWFAAGLVAGLLLTAERRWLLTPWPWVAGAVALAGLAPYVWWNAANGWPFLEFSRNAAALKVGRVSPLAFAGEQFIVMGPPAAPLWIGGLLFALFGAELRRYRAAAWIFVTTAVILAASGSARAHYLGPAYPITLAAGGVLAERLARRWSWVPAAVAVALVLLLAFALPLAMPFVPPEATIAYQDATGLRPRQENERGGRLPMHLGLYFHAEALLAPLARVYAGLSPDDQARAAILTNSFGETGAVNVLGRRRGLPPSIGRHNQYGLWGPGDATGELMLVVDNDEGELREWFESCERRAEIECSYCMEILDTQAVYVCRHARRPLRELWPRIRYYR